MICYLNYIFILLFVLFIFIIIFYFTESFTNKKKEKYTAIIVEPRQHKALELVLSNFTSNLDERWNFIIFHGTNNLDFIINILNNIIPEHKNRFTLINLNVENMSTNDYNNLLYTRDFYNNIPTEIFLIFQTDTIICKKYKDYIYKFLDYDYVGAPWRVSLFGNSTKIVGNGGLSLRKKSKMLEILDNCTHNYENEDMFFSKLISNCKYDVELKKPTIEDAMKFSVETIYNNETFGVHKPWGWIDSKNDMSFCEDYDKLVELNN